MKRKREEGVIKRGTPRKQEIDSSSESDSRLELQSHLFVDLIELIQERKVEEALRKIDLIDEETINGVDEDGWTALHWAALEGLEEVSALLIPRLNLETINAGVVYQEICANKTALHFAAEGGHAGICRSILEVSPAALNIVTTGLSDVTGSGMLALHFAAENGHKEVCILFLERKPELIHIFDGNHNTPLHSAAYGGYKEICEMILKIDSKSAMNYLKGFTVLHCAALGGNKEIFELLITYVDQEIIDSVSKDSGSVLQCAVIGGNKEICKILFSVMDKKLFNLADECGYTPLYFAANLENEFVNETNRKEMCEVFIDNMNICDVIKSLSQNKNNLNIQKTVSRIIAEFINENFNSDTVNFAKPDNHQLKLLKLYQVVRLLPENCLHETFLSEDLPFGAVNKYITTHYFELIKVCKSVNIDKPETLKLVDNKDCISYVLDYLPLSLLAEHFEGIKNIIGTVQELPSDHAGV